jgi:allantoin racemase
MTWIQVINPNTTLARPEAIGHSARAVAGPGTTVTAVTPDMGPASIESHYDEALAVPGVLAAVAEGERLGAGGHVIACFGDPGLDAARELAVGPVAGIAEAAMRTATYLGRSYSVVTTLPRTVPGIWDLTRRYGPAGACRGVHACDLPALALDGPEARAVIAKQCVTARDADGCDVIVLGCAGMTGLAAELTTELGLPVVDGVTAAVKMVEALVALGLRTSARDEYAPPPPKPYRGLLAGFTLPPDG